MSGLYAGMPFVLALVAVMLSVGILVSGGALFLDTVPSGEGRSQFARSQAAPVMTTPAPPQPLSTAREAWVPALDEAARNPASEPPSRHPSEDQNAPPGQEAIALPQPPAPSPLIAELDPLIGSGEPPYASGAMAGLQLGRLPAALGAIRHTSQELREAGDEAFRRRDFSAAVELYDRALQALTIETSLPAEAPEPPMRASVQAELAAPVPAEAVAATSPAPSAADSAAPAEKLAPAPMASAEPVKPKPEAGGLADAGRLPLAAYATLMRHGDAALLRGDISGARALYQRAASLDASAAAAHIATGKTYDPGVLAGLGVHGGALPDVTMATRWYERAQSLGEPAAAELLSRLR
ncbi:hypothetical protein SAMN04487779_10344 [Belnapia rosea]|uniref:Uncharacterized protein n=2 Tax=Belnapia rosea TaxID=938405 RepID=A0A1G7CQ55_9PROT|nr:hypothetical protein SAMN04487779_10344 [Belnapia rosea]